jgi:uncharacterized protein (TIGR03382 family)
MKKRHVLSGFLAAFLVLCGLVPAGAQNYEVLEQSLDTERHGYTVIRVWGSHYEMGYATGAAFADDIAVGWPDIKGELGARYSLARSAIATTTWLPAGIEDEVDGILAGVKSRYPNMDMDDIDVKLMNTFSDWAYYNGCRSHSCWGGFVQDPVKTLSTRRLDYSTPFDMALHHVVCAWDPDDGSPRWVNLAWPGYVAVITAVNQYGTVSSLHDFGAGATFPSGAVCRSIAARHILTGMGNRPTSGHRDWAQQELSNLEVACSSFINYYVPEGLGGVFTCQSGGPCGQLRVPQSDYFNGDVLITTNSQTDGHSTPGGDDFMDPYYQLGGVKTLQSHFELMGSYGLHLMSVEYRGEEDMTIWINGRGRSDRLELEWSELFPADQPDGGPPDAGADAGTDAGSDQGSDTGGQDAAPDSGTADDAGGGDQGQPADEDNGGGCGCGANGGAGSGLVFLLIVYGVFRRRAS